MKIINVVGARPNFMKISPIMKAYAKYPDISPFLVHTGQHYDINMSDLFFKQLEIPEPDLNLGIESGSDISKIAKIMQQFEPVVKENKPDAVLVVGDVNSTIACGMVAVKLGIKLIHVEAGLRSNDRSMPEEINRILTDSISDLLFCTEQSGVDNLLNEGVSSDKIYLVGNVMIDTLLKNKEKAESSKILGKLNLTRNEYAVLTLHRPSNVDNPVVFERILDSINFIQNDIPVIFPVHPRTRQNLNVWSLNDNINEMSNLILTDPLGYLDFLKLMSNAQIVLTDSGGIQEETTILKVPCLTLRENTERPVTIDIGSNQLVGTNPDKIIDAYKKLKSGKVADSSIPDLWDGQAADRIVKTIYEIITSRAKCPNISSL